MTLCITYRLPLPICRHHFPIGLSRLCASFVPILLSPVSRPSFCLAEQIHAPAFVCVCVCVCTCVLSGVNVVMHVWCWCINTKTWACSQTVATKTWIHSCALVTDLGRWGASVGSILHSLFLHQLVTGRFTSCLVISMKNLRKDPL